MINPLPREHTAEEFGS